MKKENNPFPVNHYVSPDYFCDRDAETKRLLSAVHNKVNTVLIANRRIGKTGLIQNTFWHLQKKGVMTFYFDIMATQSLSDFVKQFAEAIIGKIETKSDRIWKQTLLTFASLRPQISYDPLTGAPEVTVTLANEKETNPTLESLFNYIQQQSKKKKIVIAIDEFQQIAAYPEKNVEALLRTGVQRMNNVVFLFSGSSRHLLQQLFNQPSQPFYASAQMLPIEKINADVYKKYIRKGFEKGKKKISDSAMDYILQWTRGITFYVQYILNMVYASSHSIVNEEVINETLVKIVRENEMLYFSIRNLLTDAQWNLLVAIGKENGAKNILSQSFLQKYKLGSTSTTKTALTALLDREMIVKEEENYFVYDVFFSRWLQRL